MPWRRTRIALAIFSFVWFGMILPGHRRGIVVFDGGKVCDCCCGGQAGCPGDSKTPDNRGAHCEICNFAAHLTLPPVVNFHLTLLGLLEKAPPPIEYQRVWRIVLTPFDGRGPPSAA
jgi:hypothetical protein